MLELVGSTVGSCPKEHGHGRRCCRLWRWSRSDWLQTVAQRSTFTFHSAPWMWEQTQSSGQLLLCVQGVRHFRSLGVQCLVLLHGPTRQAAHILPRDQTVRRTTLTSPAGAYKYHELRSEGAPAAEWLTAAGCVTCVLRYRLAPSYPWPAPRDDLFSAVAYLQSPRAAATWRVDATRISLVGFSAGKSPSFVLLLHLKLGL
jgi:acetyl esterase/lipase